MFSSSFFRLFFYLGCVVFLSQCTTIGNSNSSHPASGMTSDAYLALAHNQNGEEKQSLQLMAAERLIAEGQWEKGHEILTGLNDLNPELATEKTLLSAKIAILRSKPKSALTSLSSVREPNSLPPHFQVQYHDTLASAYQLVGNLSESINERMKLDLLLTDENEKQKNRRTLWHQLNTLPLAELNTMAAESSADADLDGWIKLAQIYQKPSTKEGEKIAEIQEWQRLYPQHPAQDILVKSKTGKHSGSSPQHMALLVPLSGPFAGPGRAIRDGFMAAHKASGKAEEVTINFYDTHSEKATILYTKALAEGADYIVGPLIKNDVAAVATLEHPVPTLLLNDLNSPSQANVYQFSLSPNHEAKQVASKIISQGQRRVLLISPAGVWGDEIAQTFTKQLQSEGGQVVDQFNFRANQDLNKGIQQVLRISESEKRGNRLKELLGYSLETPPSRRQDFDAILIIAYPSKARQLMPLLKYYYVDNIPVYGTSTIFAGYQNPMRDRDLDGIVFCDMPWVFKNQKNDKNWPEQLNSYNRLYALGMDSYALANQLSQLQAAPVNAVKNKSGSLYLDANQHIERNLAWGQFKEGLVRQMNTG